MLVRDAPPAAEEEVASEDDADDDDDEALDAEADAPEDLAGVEALFG